MILVLPEGIRTILWVFLGVAVVVLIVGGALYFASKYGKPL